MIRENFKNLSGNHARGLQGTLGETEMEQTFTTPRASCCHSWKDSATVQRHESSRFQNRMKYKSIRTCLLQGPRAQLYSVSLNFHFGRKLLHIRNTTLNEHEGGTPTSCGTVVWQGVRRLHQGKLHAGYVAQHLHKSVSAVTLERLSLVAAVLQATPQPNVELNRKWRVIESNAMGRLGAGHGACAEDGDGHSWVESSPASTLETCFASRISGQIQELSKRRPYRFPLIKIAT